MTSLLRLPSVNPNPNSANMPFGATSNQEGGLIGPVLNYMEAHILIPYNSGLPFVYLLYKNMISNCELSYVSSFF